MAGTKETFELLLTDIHDLRAQNESTCTFMGALNCVSDLLVH